MDHMLKCDLKKTVKNKRLEWIFSKEIHLWKTSSEKVLNTIHH